MDKSAGNDDSVKGVRDRRFFRKRVLNKEYILTTWKEQGSTSAILDLVTCKYEFPIMSQAKQVDKVQVNKIDSVSKYTYIVKLI